MLGAREQFLERVDDPVPVVHPNPNPTNLRYKRISTLLYLIYQQNIAKVPSTVHQCYDTFEMNQMKSSVSEWVAE